MATGLGNEQKMQIIGHNLVEKARENWYSGNDVPTFFRAFQSKEAAVKQAFLPFSSLIINAICAVISVPVFACGVLGVVGGISLKGVGTLVGSEDCRNVANGIEDYGCQMLIHGFFDCVLSVCATIYNFVMNAGSFLSCAYTSVKEGCHYNDEQWTHEERLFEY